MCWLSFGACRNVIVADPRLTFGGDYIWGDNVVLAYVDPRPGLETLTFGATFSPDGEDFRPELCR